MVTRGEKKGGRINWEIGFDTWKWESLSCVQLFATPWVVVCQAPLSMEFSKQEYWSGELFPFPGDLPNPGTEPRSPALQVDSLPSEPPGKPRNWHTYTQFSSVLSLSHVRLFATPWIAASQASLSITNSWVDSWSLPKPMSIESVMLSNHLTLCRLFLLLPSIFPSIRVFSNESALRIRWPKY